MMNYEAFSTGLYNILNCFFIYSFLGWVMECIVISIEERGIVNRGFIKGPFCTIYGAGALSVYFILRPLQENIILLFLGGVILATVIEYLTALVMTRLFGYFWWDYNNKPFNYKGILCLESSAAWGFLTVFLFKFLHPTIEFIVSSYSKGFGKVFVSILLVIYALDFSTSFYHANREFKSKREEENELQIEASFDSDFETKFRDAN